MKRVNDYIAQLPLAKEPRGLYEPIEYVLSLGGKRIRPVLMMMAYELWKENGEDVLPQAVALETYHNFTLLHDDVMDNADVRRGKPTVHKKWNENTAILSGDNMLVLAFKWMQNLSPALSQEGNKNALEVLKTFTDTAIEINEGQQYDVDFETRDDVTEEEYIEMIRLKTSVLLACAVKIGALLAGAPKEDIDNLYAFGEAMGLAFQLQDDYLDVYGDEKVFGKAIGGDICCNKKTYMLINALQKADANDKAELQRWIAAEEYNRAEKVAAVTNIYNKVGIDKMAKAKMEEYYEKAKAALAKVNVPEERKNALYEYAAKMMKREK
ncbi:MAG: polyprenyl synthetase family protein [Prevotella sp.]|nr:polyprenyl synthetase family protein [Candidatus Prevotella equi]